MPADVLLIHGLWMHDIAMRRLAAQLRRQGFMPRGFGYFSLLQTTERVVARLSDIMTANPGLHVVAHSLGGLLTLQALQQRGAVHVGRVVCLGSPLAGSAAAEAIMRRVPSGRYLVGSNHGLLRAGVGQVPAGLEVGAVAGNVPRGLGGLLARFEGEHDGTVSVAETRVPALVDHIVVPASHSGLLFSTVAARQAAHFLRHGRFERGAGPADV